ncbi:MAG TPA: hypothetical protein VMZ03_03905 [Chitinophagaceae bacterium]|nr:hypothetical protein [Chitinophagaceae bacterium]
MKKVLGGPDQRLAFRGKSRQLGIAVMALLLSSVSLAQNSASPFDYSIRRALNQHFFERWSFYTADDTSQIRQAIKAYGYTWNRGEFAISFKPPHDTLHLKHADTGSIAVIGRVAYIWNLHTGVFKWDSLTSVGTGSSGSVTSLSQGYGIIHTPNPIISTGTIKADTVSSNGLVTKSMLRDTMAAHPALIVDSVRYTHSGAEADTLTFTTLINKSILSTEVHPYVLHEATSYPPATEDVWINNVTGGVKFGTPLQSGQTVTFIYKYSLGTGIPLVTGVQVNGGSTQTGTVSITVPAAAITQLTGEVTAGPGSGSVAATISSDAVTFGKMQNISTNKLIGRSTASTGDPEEISIGAGLSLSAGTLTNTGSGGGAATQGFVDSLRRTMYGFNGNDTGYIHMAGVIRNFCGGGTTIDWDFINNTDHAILNFSDTADAIGGQDIRVFFPAGTKCVSFIAVPDETMATAGYQIGASYSLDHADIRIGKLRNQSAAVWFNGITGGIDIYGNTFGGITYDTTTGKFTVTVNNPANYLQTNYSTSITSASTTYYPVIDGSASHGTGNKVYFYLYKRSDNTLVTGTHPLQSLVYLSAAPYWTAETVNDTVGSGLGCGGSANIWLFAVLKKH